MAVVGCKKAQFAATGILKFSFDKRTVATSNGGVIPLCLGGTHRKGDRFDASGQN